MRNSSRYCQRQKEEQESGALASPKMLLSGSFTRSFWSLARSCSPFLNSCLDKGRGDKLLLQPTFGAGKEILIQIMLIADESCGRSEICGNDFGNGRGEVAVENVASHEFGRKNGYKTVTHSRRI